MVTVLLLQVMEDGKVEGWFVYVRVWVGGQEVGIIFFLFFCFCAAVNCYFVAGT